MRISGVVLAAGPSRRFGTDPPKQLALIEGEPMVRRVVRVAIASRLSEVIVVVGMAAARVEAAIEDLDARVVRNDHYEEGQSTSVKAGLAAVGAEAAAALFVPIDQPRLSTSVINALLYCHQQTGAAIVVPTYERKRGAPVLFGRSLFDDLATIDGDAGGRQIFPLHEGRLVELPLASGEPLRDLDSPEDLLRLDG